MILSVMSASGTLALWLVVVIDPAGIINLIKKEGRNKRRASEKEEKNNKGVGGEVEGKTG